jgi:hypothetical protein
MKTGARARGLAGWARGGALGDGVSGCWAAAAKVPGAHTRMTVHSVNVGAQCASARCAILIGSTAIRNLRIPLKPHDMFFSNRSKIACLRARFAHVSRTSNHQSPCTTRAFLIASRQLLEIELTNSQQTRKLFLIASFSAVLSAAMGMPHRERYRQAGMRGSCGERICMVTTTAGTRRMTVTAAHIRAAAHCWSSSADHAKTRGAER